MKAVSRCFALACAILIFYSLPVAPQQTRQTLSRHVPLAVSTGAAKLVGSVPSTQRMNLSIVLPLRNQEQLTNLLKQIYDPSSPDYRHFLSVADFAERFGPAPDDYQAVIEYAKAQGFTVKSQPADRMVVPINGTVEQVQKAFSVKMLNYQHPTEAREFFSPDREPTVPAGLSVRHISGLNNYSLPMSMAVKLPAGAKSVSVLGSGPYSNYMPSDMRAAYYGGTALTGKGQTLGLVQFDGYDISDVISAFYGRATLTTSGSDPVINYTPPNCRTTYPVPVHNVLLDGATGASNQFYSDGDGEQVLDIAQSIGMAPGLNQVRVYIGANDVDILSKIADEDLANVVSISWAWNPDDPSAVDQYFQQMASQGQSVFAASGDYGAYSPTMPYYFPAEDPWVTAVGGTELTTDGPGGPLVIETAWNQSGGGVSPDSIAIPTWQAGIANSSNNASNTLRNVPDVAMEADFDNFNCSMGSCSTGWAGTSFAAPRWAAFTALINEQAVAKGDAPVGFLNPRLYLTAQGSSYGTEYHDIVYGENNYEADYGFYAQPGYDLVTGWGSPTGQNLIDAIAPPPSSSAPGFALTTTLGGVTISAGSSAATTIGVAGVGGFSGSVNLSVGSNLPSGVTASFSANPTSGTSVLTLTASILAVAQTFNVTVAGTSGSLQATTYVAVSIPSNAVVLLSPVVPSSPVAATFIKPSTVIGVTGSVLGQPQSITLSWAPGVYPASGWTTQGIAQNQPAAPFSSANIGTWDTSSIATAGYYTIEVSAVYTQGTVTAKTLVYLEPELVSNNWPKWLPANPGSVSGVIPIRETSGTTGLAVMEPLRLGGTSQAAYQVFSVDGSSQHATNLSGGGAGAAYGVRGYGQAGESIMADSRSMVTVAPDGTTNSLPLDGVDADLIYAQTVLSPLNGEGSLAAVTVGNQFWTNLAFVFAWGPDGNLLNSNFPIQIPNANFSTTFGNNQQVLSGDVDGDGEKEIIAVEAASDSTWTLAMFNRDGTPRAWQAPTLTGTPEQMILADLDHNGKHALVVAVQNSSTSHIWLHVLNADGTERTGWPVDLNIGPAFLAAGDLAQNGAMEIVAASGQYLSVFKPDGTSYSSAWPITGFTGVGHSAGWGPVALADVDGDGHTEILSTYMGTSYVDSAKQSSPAAVTMRRSSGAGISSNYVDAGYAEDASSEYWSPQLRAYRLDGSISKTWQLPGANNEQPCCSPQITVGDFSNDGTTDIAVVNPLLSGGGTSGFEYDGVIEVLATKSAFHPDSNLWPSLYRDTWNTATADFVVPAAAPQFSVPAGTYGQAQTVALFDLTPGATIHYTTDGTTPSLSSTIYTGAISISSTGTIQAIAVASAYTNSPVAAALYTINPPAATPTFSVTAGTYTSPQAVAISDASAGTTIYFTTDGSTPATSSSVYSTAISVSTSETIKAIASGSNFSASSVASAAYTINLPAATPTFSVTPGTYTSVQTVSISDSTPGAVIYYTTNGATPTTGSTLYSGPISVSSTETIESIAIVSGYSSSAVSTAVFTITPPAATPKFSVTPGAYTSVQTVAISDTTPGAVIYYTTNGSMPTTGSTLYSGPILVAATETIKAIATASGHSSSPVTTAVYTITPPAAAPVMSSISPVFTDAGGAPFTLTITGSGFASNAVVYWGATALSTHFVSTAEVTAQIPAADIVNTGATAITVETPAPSATKSNALQFEVDSASGATSSPTFTNSSATVTPGSTASYPVTLPTSATNVSASCLNLPTGATCSYSSATGSVTISTTTATSSGTYQVTVVFAETVSGTSSALVLLPILLFPLVATRKKRQTHRIWLLACLGIALTTGVVVGCGGSGSVSTTPPATHQVTSSGVVSITVQ